MWLIAGLGNPGKEYEETRHNIGFKVIDSLSKRFSISLRYKTKYYIYGKGLIEGEGAILLKPLTFMNKSGLALKTALRRFSNVENTLIIHDDLDLLPYTIRIKKGGSSGGHRGVESIIQFLGTGAFMRLRIGIGRSKRLSPEKYVLSPFPKREESIVKKAIEEATEAVTTVLTMGISIAQNRFHSKEN